MEVAVASLATDRALLLLGVPGTAKTWVSEHLAAAISGDSTLVVQGTAGTPEEALRYGWNYARLLAEGPTRAALVPSPVMRAMETGALVRIEELTRIPADVQDALITILSEKHLPIPELDAEVQAQQGFNVIATANNRDKGVNDLSSALEAALQHRRAAAARHPRAGGRDRRATRVDALGRVARAAAGLESLAEIERVVTVFRELRSGVTADQRTTVKSPSATLSTAEAISVDDQRPRRWRRTSATASCGPTTWRPAWSGPSSRTRSRTESSGRSTSRPWSRTEREWADLYRAAASSADMTPVTCASRCSGSGTTARARRGRSRAPWRSCCPTSSSSRGRPSSTPRPAGRATRTSCPGGRARLCRRRAPRAAPSIPSRSSLPSGSRCAGRVDRGVDVRLRRPAGDAPRSADSRAEAPQRSLGQARRPDLGAGVGRGLRRSRAVVGGRRRAPARHRS